MTGSKSIKREALETLEVDIPLLNRFDSCCQQGVLDGSFNIYRTNIR